MNTIICSAFTYYGNYQNLVLLFFLLYFYKEIMTLRQRNKSPNNPHSVREMIVTSVFNTMQIEGRPVPEAGIERLYDQVKK